MKKAIVIGALLLGCAAVFWAVTPKQEDRLNMEEQEKQIVTPNTDLARLAEITTVVGQPAVLWARIPMGRIDQTGRLPGPTDLGLIAVLDYGTASAAETALGGAKGEASELDFAKEPVRYNWFPGAILDTITDGKIAVVNYGFLDQFGDARVSSVTGAPQILLLTMPLP